MSDTLADIATDRGLDPEQVARVLDAQLARLEARRDNRAATAAVLAPLTAATQARIDADRQWRDLVVAFHHDGYSQRDLATATGHTPQWISRVIAARTNQS